MPPAPVESGKAGAKAGARRRSTTPGKTAGRIEIEPDESEFGKILKRAGGVSGTLKR